MVVFFLMEKYRALLFVSEREARHFYVYSTFHLGSAEGCGGFGGPAGTRSVREKFTDSK